MNIPANQVAAIVDPQIESLFQARAAPRTCITTTRSWLERSSHAPRPRQSVVLSSIAAGIVLCSRHESFHSAAQRCTNQTMNTGGHATSWQQPVWRG